MACDSGSQSYKRLVFILLGSRFSIFKTLRSIVLNSTVFTTSIPSALFIYSLAILFITLLCLLLGVPVYLFVFNLYSFCLSRIFGGNLRPQLWNAQGGGVGHRTQVRSSQRRLFRGVNICSVISIG